jgi:hypothetical protein
VIQFQLRRRTAVIALVGFVTVAVAAFAALGLTLTRTADASHKFNDVGSTNFFHDSTAWLKDNGIADGFNGGRFQPNSNITRGQASYWFSNYNDALEVVQFTFAPGSGTGWASTAKCPTGKRPVAGGGEVGTNFSTDMFMVESHPDMANNAWRVRWESEGNTNFVPPDLTIWALCVPDTIDKP